MQKINSCIFKLIRIAFEHILLTTFLALMICGQAKNDSDAPSLSLGQRTEREIKAGETHSYSIGMNAGQYVYIVVEQRGIDVLMRLFDLNGKQLVLVDSPNGSHGPEVLSFVAEISGIYRLDLQPVDKRTSSGPYTVELKELRTASEKDRALISAERAYAEGNKLRSIGADPTLRNALVKYEEALRIFRNYGNRQGEAKTLRAIGNVYFYTGDKQKGLDYTLQALQIIREIGPRKEEAALLSALFAIYRSLGQNSVALDFINQSLLIYKALGDDPGVGDTLFSIGAYYFDVAERQKSLDAWMEALSIFRKLTDKSKEALVLSRIFWIYRALGQKQKALETAIQSLNTYRSIGDKKGEAGTLLRLGLAYSDLGEKPKGLEIYYQVLPLQRELGDKMGEANTFNYIGNILVSSGEPRKALEAYDQALAIEREINYKDLEEETIRQIASVYNILKEYQKALEFYEEALLSSRIGGRKRAEGFILIGIGSAYRALGQVERAIENYDQSLQVYEEISDRFGVIVALNNLRESWAILKQPSAAIFYGKQAVNENQKLRQSISGMDRGIQETYLKTVQRSYERLADLLIAEGRLAEAEQVLSMLKEEEVFSYLQRDDKAAKELLQTVSLTEKEQQALSRYDKLAHKITAAGREYNELSKRRKRFEEGKFPEQARYDDLKKQLSDAKTAFQKFPEELKIELARQKDERAVQMDSGLQNMLKRVQAKRTVIVSTIIGEDRLNIIVTTGNTQQAHSIDISEKGVNQLVAEFRRTLMNPEIDPRPASQALYDILVKPIETELAGSDADTILWSLDGALRYISPAALWDQQKGYLVERFASTVLTLSSLDALMPPVTKKTDWKVLGVGVSKLSQGFKALTAVPDELDCIVTDPEAKTVSPAPACKSGVMTGRKLLDEKFTLAAFESSLRQYPIIHIASHFSLNPGNYKDSFLLLGGGDQKRFTVEDLRRISLTGVELIVLSACNTATPGSERNNGLEIEGFSAIAQKQGAKTVMATLWPVADESTRDLMVRFYRIYGKGDVSKAAAIRQAQLAMIYGGDKSGKEGTARGTAAGNSSSAGKTVFKKDPGAPYSHPYYWSPFVMFGNWQ